MICLTHMRQIMITDITSAYKNYAVYIPSLQESYAEKAISGTYKETRKSKPLPFDESILNFLDKNSPLWHHNCTLFSCGLFPTSTIEKRSIVAERKRSDTIIVGDSGGFQLGQNSLKRKETNTFFKNYTDKPNLFAKRWKQCGEVERVVNFLNAYCDYSMTLDMVMWGSKQANPNSVSPLRNLTVQQLIDLTVENLKYIDAQRSVGNEHKTKWLNVTQCIGNIDGTNSGLEWYNAVKDFEFEGWAFGGGTAFHFHQLLRWVRKIINDNNFDNREWIHVLMKSPPSHSILYTVIKHKINQICNTDIQITYDSSSASQSVGKQRSLYQLTELTSDIKTWNMTAVEYIPTKDEIEGTVQTQFPSWHPLSKFATFNDLVVRKDLHQTSYFDTATWEIMKNYNMYVQHLRAINACDLYYDDELKNHKRIPTLLLELAEYANEYLETENPNDFEKKHTALLKDFDTKFASIKAALPKTEDGWQNIFADFEF